ncbi:unnamed protein product [Dibothriocephalus latus]|uniref:GAT domain-containing protein n=1 Tax=Dibothriocephalus latus TaxID=60516 RepID=A0A3P7RKN7_DIBLA|nr:unnamed protein product [Dibothriocephalus latus]
MPTQTMNPTERGLAEVNDASRTLREARETLRLFDLLQQNSKSSSSVEIDATQMWEFQVVAERLKVLQEKVHALINAVVDGISTDITEDDEIALAYFTSLNDELLRCVEICRQTARKYEVSILT